MNVVAEFSFLCLLVVVTFQVNAQSSSREKAGRDLSVYFPESGYEQGSDFHSPYGETLFASPSEEVVAPTRHQGPSRFNGERNSNYNPIYSSFNPNSHNSHKPHHPKEKKSPLRNFLLIGLAVVIPLMLVLGLATVAPLALNGLNRINTLTTQANGRKRRSPELDSLKTDFKELLNFLDDAIKNFSE